MKKVSMIIPVYNVENYLSYCLQSVCNQTYSNLEILIVYDKCSDNSLNICMEWADKDSRIRIIINESRVGLGAARNIGLKQAIGHYVMYLDSDDWCEPYYVEKLVKVLENSDADYASYSGIYWETEDSSYLRHSLPAGTYTSVEKEIILLREFPAVWKKIYRREWLLEKELYQPELFGYEDWGFNMPFVLSCNKIELLPRAAVHYRTSSSGSIYSKRLKRVQEFQHTVQYGINELENRNLLEKHKIALFVYFCWNYSLEKEAVEKINDKDASIILEETKKWFIDKLQFQKLPVIKHNIAFGSFNTRWIMQKAGIFSADIEYYGFSSLISAMNTGEHVNIIHNNSFRQKQIQMDIEGSFMPRLTEIQDPTTIFIDLLEERNNILCSDTYITDSDAYRGSKCEGNSSYRIIKSGSDEFYSLWQEKCKQFIDILYEKRHYLQLYLVKSRMALQYGNMNDRYNFDEPDRLIEINQRIQKLEDFFTSYCKQRKLPYTVLELPKKYLFTDEDFTYGCQPFNLNNFCYTYVGLDLAKKYLITEGT